MSVFVVSAVYILSGFHAVLGLISVCVGIVASIKAEVWMAHNVSPIWSGAFFIITGILGVLCAKRKSSYVIMCFTAFSVVSMVTAVVSIQLLRLGLVNYTTDGHTFQKKDKDALIIVALTTAGSECLICLLSTLCSCRMAKVAKEEMCKRREGMFHVKDNADMNGNEVTHSTSACDTQTSGHSEDLELNVIDASGVRLSIETPRYVETTGLNTDRPFSRQQIFQITSLVRENEAAYGFDKFCLAYPPPSHD
ncbi:hypothetical protein ACJMK2_037487 [Sinanodonta woodiana]|uniref:Transmembrane protein 196 n=1 Tax=Sinanodonta woodiana TaxID=1069815 RepID=A0ABD3WP26_SINWO